MNKYYEVVGLIDGQTMVLFGSFDRSDCVYEIDAEKTTWKNEGYKQIKIVSRNTEDQPDPEVYGADFEADNNSAPIEYTTQGETKVIKALVKNILKAGYSISVYDGEEETLTASKAPADIYKALATSSDDRIYLIKPCGNNAGFFWLIYGNADHEVIADYSANDVCEAIYSAIESTIESVEV